MITPEFTPVEVPHVMSLDLQAHLAGQFDPTDVLQLVSARQADVPYVENEQIIYSRLNEGQGTPTLIVSGFTESIPSLAPLALELTHNADGSKNDVIIVEQHRVGTHVNSELDKKGRPTENQATEMQALNNLAVLEREVTEGPLRIVAHSYGALIVQKMVELAKKKAEETGSQNAMEKAEVVFVAPTGTHSKEGLVKLGGRFLRHSVTELFSQKAVKDKNGEMMKSATKNASLNIRRTWQEICAMSKDKINYPELRQNVGSLAVMAFAKDRLFPQRVLDETMSEAIEAGVAYMTPIQVPENPKDHKRKASVRGSTHNDSSFTPSRVSNAVKQYFETIEA